MGSWLRGFGLFLLFQPTIARVSGAIRVARAHAMSERLGHRDEVLQREIDGDEKEDGSLADSRARVAAQLTVPTAGMSINWANPRQRQRASAAILAFSPPGQSMNLAVTVGLWRWLRAVGSIC